MTEKIVPFTIEQWQFPMRKGSEIQFSADCKHSLASFLFCLPANLNQVSVFKQSAEPSHPYGQLVLVFDRSAVWTAP